MTTEVKNQFPQVTDPIEEDEMLMFEDVVKDATPGHWGWFGNTDSKRFHLATRHGGRIYVMDFVRYGMRNAQPRFQVPNKPGGAGLMTKAHELVRYTVAPEAGPNRKDPRVYRADISGFDHPDATFMEVFSPTNVIRLLTKIRNLEAELAERKEKA